MKIRRISNFQTEFSFFSLEENFHQYQNRFYQSDLGKIYQAIPWDDLVKNFGLKPSKKGPASIFSPRGKIALMILKNYSDCSDRRLMEQLNSNIDYQFFCDLYLGLNNRLINYKIVSEIRCELAKKLDVNELQQILADYWKPFIQEKHSMLTDATCYESHVRYPTDQKILWESVEWSHSQMKLMCKYAGIKLPRTKFLKWKDRYSNYSRKRRKNKTERVVLTRSLLLLLHKLNGLLDDLEHQYDFTMPKRYYKRRGVIKEIYKQQNQLFTTGEKPKNRIVSISKDYIRPIVRGKEVKAVEFGAKVNKIQIDGIGFIEHLSFDAFHEGNRFKQSVYTAQQLMGTRMKIVGADAIYATNENRKFATSNNIRTDFKRKGRASKHEAHRKQLSSIITKERATRLEGSFGNDKEYYHLKKIKARTKLTETLWIFFGIHTANSLEIGRRMVRAKQSRAA